MSETKLGVDPTDEPVAGAGIAQPDIATDQVAPEAKLFTQDQVNDIVSQRLREGVDRAAREREAYEQATAQRLSYLESLIERQAQATAAANPQDPYRDLTPDERMLAKPAERAARVAYAPLEQKMDAFMRGVQQMVAPIAAERQASQFFASQGNVPEYVRQRTLAHLQAYAEQGINMQGAYTLALSDYGKAHIAGTLPTAPAAPKPAPRAQAPQVMLGGANPSALPTIQPSKPRYTHKDTPVPGLRQFFDDAVAAGNQWAPEEGTAVGDGRVGPYRDPTV